MYMDNIKLLAKNEKALEILMKLEYKGLIALVTERNTPL